MDASNKERESEGQRHASSKLSSAMSGGANASLGITFGVTVLFFVGVGWLLDDRFGSSPLFLIVGMLLGAIGGFVSLLKKVPPAGGRRKDG
jgi:F0F1-type ATP synthase assembly protein I